ncbi:MULTISPECIES: hypothetical protein [unclassified Myroides]|uniref:hypothetical protein n=1 Tax=unclassified Myroides TaxID=2642485 RepID=UPI003100E946
MENKVFQLFRCFLCICMVFLVSCKEHSDTEKGEVSLTEQGQTPNGVDKDIVKERKIYTVEGVDNEGNTYRGKIALKGDVGAGRICSDNTKEIYIDVKRSLEGGVEGVDNNGNVYQLLFMSKEE